MNSGSTFSFSRTEGGLFSPTEVRALMEVEFQRARRHGYPVCCLALRPDRIEELGLFLGQESKEEVLRTVVSLVRRTIRAGDLLGYGEQDRLVLLLPHLPPESLQFLCQRILKGARELVFDGGGGTHRTSLSIGASHSQHPEASSCEVLERVAIDGLEVAEAAGGDRWIESELYGLEARRTREVADAGDRHPDAEQLLPDYRERLVAMVEGGEQLQAAAERLADEIVTRALASVQSIEGTGDGREMELLKRRLAKLTSVLGVNEKELEQLRAFRASVEAEGAEPALRGERVSGTEDDLKKALMQSIFQANQDLRRRSGESGAA